MTDNWYSPRDIRFRPEHIYFLILHKPQLEQGDYPDEPSNYFDAGGARAVNRLKFEIFVGLASEINYRLEKCGKDGEILVKSVQLGELIPDFSQNAKNALYYCSGWKRKRMTYRNWLKERRYILRKRHNLTNLSSSASVKASYH